MPPDDPLGRNGPTLDRFLRRKPSGPGNMAPSSAGGSSSLARQGTVAITPCPYGKKCTYGNKCKFWHTQLCNFFTQGNCKSGTNCRYAHPPGQGNYMQGDTDPDGPILPKPNKKKKKIKINNNDGSSPSSNSNDGSSQSSSSKNSSKNGSAKG